MSLTPGARIGPYEVTTLIGQGGMGEVYRATDTNLARGVAIKVLPEAFAQDAERLARFEREARTLGSLNHPPRRALSLCPFGPLDLTACLCNVHIACMSTKTISLKREAYERLRAARRYPAESFSEVVLRATWPEDTTTARALLDSYRTGRPRWSDEELDRIEALKRRDAPPEDKWANR